MRFTLRFWQELIFLFSISILVLEFTKGMILKDTLDAWDITLAISLIPITLGLSFQFIEFHKKTAFILAGLLIASSSLFLFMAMYNIVAANGEVGNSMGMLLWSMPLVGTAISHPFTYSSIARFKGH